MLKLEIVVYFAKSDNSVLVIFKFQREFYRWVFMVVLIILVFVFMFRVMK